MSVGVAAQLRKIFTDMVVEAQMKGKFEVAKGLEYTERQVLAVLANHVYVDKQKLEDFLEENYHFMGQSREKWIRLLDLKKLLGGGVEET